jgi:hypothetical protein
VRLAPPRVVGRRGTCLLFFSLLDFVYALSLWRPAAAASATTRFLADVMPLHTWASLWLAVGAVCLAGAFAHRFDPIAFTCAAGIKMLWAAVFAFGWIAGEIERGWVGAAVWLAFALLVMTLAGWPDDAARPNEQSPRES